MLAVRRDGDRRQVGNRRLDRDRRRDRDRRLDRDRRRDRDRRLDRNDGDRGHDSDRGNRAGRVARNRRDVRRRRHVHGRPHGARHGRQPGSHGRQHRHVHGRQHGTGAAVRRQRRHLDRRHGRQLSTGSGGSGSTSSTAAGTIVPLYTDPSDSSWNAIITAAVAHPTVHVVAIVNPSDGPGSSKSSAYTSGIAALQAAHIEVIGYVATGYGSHSIASMESEMDQWKSFYPTLQGIFFDEQSNSTSDVAHYQTLSQYAKSLGLNHTVGNPGTDVPAAYIGALDTMLIYESNGVPSISSLAQWSSYAPSNFGVIPYAVSAMNTTFVQQARQYVEYIYLTNDDLPNPWDSLTSYFSALMTALE